MLFKQFTYLSSSLLILLIITRKSNLNNMIYHIWFIIALLCITIRLSSSMQFYDYTNCTTDPDTYQGSRYTCETNQDLPCQTYLVFRSNQRFHNISEISKLFQKNPDKLLQENKHLNINSTSQFLEAGKEVLIPIICSCSAGFYQVNNLTYVVPENTTFPDVACGVFEGLLKSSTLKENNLNMTISGSELNVPLRCACPDNNYSTSIGKKVKYLVTYPILQGDSDSAISDKFGISEDDFRKANRLQLYATLYAQTTVLIPLVDYPIKITNTPLSSPPPPYGVLPILPVGKTEKNPTTLYIASSIIGFLLLIMAIIVCVLYSKALRKWKSESVQPFTTPSTSVVMSPLRGSSTTSCLSRDVLAGIKYCLVNYSIEELKMATKDFSEETKKSGSVYKGLITDVEVMIKRMRFEDMRRVIDLHSKINHINIVNLLGVCYDESDLSSWSYLVFEWPKNGCLRDYLSDGSKFLCWKKRTQIAFDIATVLHYLHCCAFPSYVHLNVSSRNIFITEDFRGKLADIAAPGDTSRGKVYEKVDIFAFGVVLLELISARENFDGKLVKDSIGFLGGGGGGDNEGGCFEGLRSFMDPNLKEDYHLAEALCLAVLAKACVADDPLHRPTMDDIMKVIAKMVSPQQPEK